MHFLKRVLFCVIKHEDHLVFERIDPIDQSDTLVNFENSFSRQAISEITSRCIFATSADMNAASFTAILNESNYDITLLGRFENAFIFLAEQEPQTSATYLPETSNFITNCNTASKGVFFWRVKDGDFHLTYANSFYCLQAGLSSKCIRKTPEDIFSPNRALLIRSHMIKCVNSMKPVSYIYSFSKMIFVITLYPQIKNGRVARILGTSTDITKALDKFVQTEKTKESSSRYETMLQENIQFEELLSRCARDFLDSGLAGFNDCIEKMVMSIGQLYDADWAFACKDPSALCGISSQWIASVEKGRDRLCRIVRNHDFDKWLLQLKAGRLFAVNDIHTELPGLYSALKGAGSPDVRSFIAVPVFRADEFWGVLCVSTFRQKRIWSAKEIGVLKTTADIVMSAYLRTKIEKQLSESNRVLAEYDECLQDILSVQESLGAVSRRFLTADTHEFSGCVSHMLGVLGDLTDIDHASIALVNGDVPQYFSWHKRGMSFQSLKHGSNGFDMYSWISYLNDSDHIAIDDLSLDMGTLPSFALEYYLNTGIKSLLIIPIRTGKTIIAVLTLVKVLGSCHWDNSTIHTTQQFADVFIEAHSNYSKQLHLLAEAKSDTETAKETITQAKLIKSIAEYLLLLIDVSAENLLPAFRKTCQAIARHLPINSVNLTQYSPDSSKSHIVFKWYEKGGTPSAAQADCDKQVVLSIPVYHQDVVWGCLLVNITCHFPSGEYVRVLEMMAQCFVRAYMRIYPDIKDSAAIKHAATLSAHAFSSHCAHSPAML